MVHKKLNTTNPKDSQTDLDPIQNTGQNTGFDWQKGLQLSLPVAMGYVPAGVAFGVLALVAGLPIWAIVLLSVCLYAGAAQYACLPMLSAGLPIGTVATNIFAINIRHVFYGLPLLSALPDRLILRIYCLFALTDETFSVMASVPKSEQRSVFFPVSLFNQAYWVLASLLGALVGSQLDGMIPHLDFALLALFAVLAYEQFIQHKKPVLIVVAMVALVISWAINAFFGWQWVLLIAIAISAVLILCLRDGSDFAVPNSSNNQHDQKL